MRRAAFPSQNRRRQQAWPPRRRFGCGVSGLGLKAPSFKDTAQKRWNREAKAADRADHRWRHEEAAAAAAQNEQAQASAFEEEEEDAARRWEEEMAAALPPPPPKALSPREARPHRAESRRRARVEAPEALRVEEAGHTTGISCIHVLHQSTGRLTRLSRRASPRRISTPPHAQPGSRRGSLRQRSDRHRSTAARPSASTRRTAPTRTVPTAAAAA